MIVYRFDSFIIVVDNMSFFSGGFGGFPFGGRGQDDDDGIKLNNKDREEVNNTEFYKVL
jgi:hypothetical protein